MEANEGEKMEENIFIHINRLLVSPSTDTTSFIESERYVCYLPISYDMQLFACLLAYWPDGFFHMHTSTVYTIHILKSATTLSHSQKVQTRAPLCVSVCVRACAINFHRIVHSIHRKPDQTNQMNL